MIIFPLTRRLVILAVLVLAPTTVARAQVEPCSNVLKEIRNKLVTSNTAMSKEIYIRDFFRMTDQQAYDEYNRVKNSSNDTSLMFQVTIPIEGVPVTPKGDGAHSEKLDETEFKKRVTRWRETVKDQIHSEKYFDESNYYEQSKIDPGVVRAWADCMSEEKIFAYATRSASGGVVINVSYSTKKALWFIPSFITDDGVRVEVPGKISPIHGGSRPFKVVGRIQNGFNISVGGRIVSKSGDTVSDVPTPIEVSVGPMVLVPLGVTSPPAITEDKDLGNLQEYLRGRRKVSYGPKVAPKEVMSVSGVYPQLRGRRLYYSIVLGTYRDETRYWYTYNIWVNGKQYEKAIECGSPTRPAYGDSVNIYNGHFEVPENGKVDIRVEIQTLDDGTHQVPFYLVNSSIQVSLLNRFALQKACEPI